MNTIPFNRPLITGKEQEYLVKAIELGKLSGDGPFTKECSRFFGERFGCRKVLLTTSCSDALELIALLLDIRPGDEIILPSYNFVSAANAFVLRGAELVFADSMSDHPNIDARIVEELITPKTKAILCVHYAGMSCDLMKLKEICTDHSIFLIEDAAHAIDSKWNGKQQLGTIGDLGTFSFHETKNITCGEGGALLVNNDRFAERAEIIRSKGTNRKDFELGKVSHYEWVDVGSSFLPSELNTAFLLAQTFSMDKVQQKRKALWHSYHQTLESLELAGKIRRPAVHAYAEPNGHIYYLECDSREERNQLIGFLKKDSIHAVFHYQSLHSSRYFRDKHGKRPLPNADRFSDRLLRLPMFYDLRDEELNRVVERVTRFYSGKK